MSDPFMEWTKLAIWTRVLVTTRMTSVTRRNRRLTGMVRISVGKFELYGGRRRRKRQEGEGE